MTACDVFTWALALTCAALGLALALPALTVSVLASVDIWRHR